MTKTIVRIRLSEILKERCMTRQQLALLTGLRPSTVSDLCKPTASRIYLSTIAAVCDALDIAIDELIVSEGIENN
ncbi:helix-turn-helix domain-containing protein [Cohnella rhizosphaerae]|uniref:Helix-turn-helix transcriptional regulator n=1 Tax=Cohnella rhizosphaerae TaxID=1457232 RepID=A0A9X4L0D2_9BACL|nr:helix-turn-helix transcriptional regulator [Cohnella rhizosphaerae]MDG0814218.1 helix-turn-helix transcriptional regulator [Cohnella rhizosphaerae]